jgi:hypothetical protein
MKTRISRAAKPLSSEARQGIEVQLGRVTALPARVDRLDAPEQHELAELVRKAKGDDNGDAGAAARRHLDLALLSKKDRQKLERLIEKSADAEGAFSRERDEAETRTQMAALAQRARVQTRPRYEEEGSVVLPRQFFEHLRDGINQAGELLAFIYVMGQLEGGEAFGLRCQIEGDALVLDQHGSLAPPGGDPDSHLGNARQALEHLARNGYLALSRTGKKTYIRRGSRWLTAVERRNQP